MFKLLRYLKDYWLHIVGILICVIIQVNTDLMLPDFMSRIVNEGIIAQNNNVVLTIGAQMLLVSLLGVVATIITVYLASFVATSFSRNMRSIVFKKIEHFSLAEFDKFSTASLITRTTNDIQQIQMLLVIGLRMLLMAPLMGVGAIIKAIGKNPSMSWIIMASVCSIIILILVIFKIAVPKFKLVQRLTDKLNLVTREFLTGLRVIRAFNNEKAEEKRFDDVNIDLTEVNLFVNRIMVTMQPIMMLIFNITTLAVIWFGSKQIDIGNMQIGDMMAFMQYAMQALMAFLMLSMIFVMFPRAAVSGDRVLEVIETEQSINDPETEEVSLVNDGTVEFRNVAFSYPLADAPVLSNISFTARAGETTAIIGSTGSGKSTIVNLIARFYDVTDGSILIDGVDVRNMKQSSLREKLGFVPQKANLFSGTIESNIKYGVDTLSESDMKIAATTAQAINFINETENGFNSPISQGGTNVSGGQKQRLAIARAIAKNPEIYIFDDSFSALDFKTDAELRRALKENIKDTTLIIVAQRISTIMDADKIIVLEKGEIEGIGKHKELLENCSVYKEIALSQLSKEELQ